MDFKKETSGKYILIFSILIISGLLINSYYVNKSNLTDLKSNYTLTKAKIIDFEMTIHTTSTPTKISYYLLDQKFTGNLSFGTFCKVLEKDDKIKLKKIKFDLAVNNSNPKVFDFIITNDQYKEYGIEDPSENSNLDKAINEYFLCEWSFWRWLN